MTTLREERASVWEQMRALSTLAAAEGRDLTSDEYRKYERLESDLDLKAKHIERLEMELGLDGGLSRVSRTAFAEPIPVGDIGNRGERRAAELTARVNRLDRPDEAVEELRALADKVPDLRNRAQRGDGNARLLYFASSEYRDAFVDYLRGRGEIANLGDEQRAALNIGTGAQGGYTVPAEFYRQLIQSERFFGVIAQLARVIVTADNGTLSVPVVDDANRLTAAWVAEAGAFTESEDQFKQTQLAAFKAGTIAKVSDELVLDSAFDIVGFVGQSAGQALAILTNTSYVTGASGSTTTPEGLFTKATIGYTEVSGNTTAPTYKGTVELYHSVRPAYRSRGVWVASDQTIKALRQMVDSQNRPLWEPSLQLAEPDRYLGRPVYADPDVAAPAANALSLGFGDVFSAYMIRNVQDVTAKILNELYAVNGQIGVRVHRRTDGDIVDTLAFKTLKQSAT